jgi:oligogalacturonide transport system permease protein
MSKVRNVKSKGFLKAFKKDRAGYMFTAPWIAGFLIFVLWPLIQSFTFSLNRIRVTPLGRELRFVGFNNYRDVWLKDMFFVQRLLSFIINTILRVPVIVVFALIIAILINGKIKFKGIFRTIFFLPVIVASGPVMAKLVTQGATTVPMMNQALIMGILTRFLPQMVAESVGALFGQIIIILWQSGVQILIFLAALQKVDFSLYEAAKIDGGSRWECFWKITLPTIKPMLFLNAVYTLVSLANSDQNEIINLIYNNMFDARRGYGFASAMAWMYAVIVCVLLVLISLMFREKKTAR